MKRTKQQKMSASNVFSKSVQPALSEGFCRRFQVRGTPFSRRPSREPPVERWDSFTRSSEFLKHINYKYFYFIKSA